MTPIANHTHHEFISQTLPNWYLKATPQTRQALQQDMVRSHQLRERVSRLLAGITPLDDFARPLLTKALEAEFGPGLDVDAAWYYKPVYKTDAYGEPTLAAPELCLQSLLHAALQNFHEEELSDASATAKVQIVQIKRVTDQRYGSYDTYPLHPMQVDPVRFMRVCRQLDLGGQYQKHLNLILDHPPGRRLNQPAADPMGARELAALKVHAHVAFMKGDIGSDFYRHLAGLPEQGSSEALACSSLKICGFSARDIVVFMLKSGSGCVLYAPGEPDANLLEFKSFQALARALRARFTLAYCKAFISRYIALRSKGAFLHQVAQRIAPGHLRFDPNDESAIPHLTHAREVDPDFDLNIELDEIPYDLPTWFQYQKMLRIKDDARVLAVPTGDEDEASRRARLAGYLALGMNAVNLAALFVPLLGEAMMVVAGAQLLAETFEGVGAWQHGDMDQALEHLGSVAQNLAFMTAFGALIKAGSAPPIPPVKGSSFIGRMVPVKLPSGEVRLWAPDLTPFAHDIAVPEGAQLTAEGILERGGKHYLPLEGRFYPVTLDTDLNKWRVEPVGGKGFSPALEHNGVGGWRHEGEAPSSWSRQTSFKRLGPEFASLPEHQIDTVMKAAAVDDAGLLDLHLENKPPPAILLDAIHRFSLDEQVRVFHRHISGAGFASADVHLQMELLTSSPRWPGGRPIQVVDGQGATLAEYGQQALPPGHPASSASLQPLKIDQARVARGELLSAVIDGLGEGGRNRLFGRVSARTPQYLAAEIARLAQGRSGWLFDSLLRRSEASNEPQINLLKRDFPSLSNAAARELLAGASGEQLAGMATSQRIPLEIAGRVRAYLREGRLYRALEGFCLACRADNPDTLKVATALLEDLPGWPSDLRIEIREGSLQGDVLESIGPPDAHLRRVLIKRDQSYRALDESGAVLDPTDTPTDNFFSAVLHALPKVHRQALGFADPLVDAARLRESIISSAFEQRTRVSKILGQWFLGPRSAAPVRLADGRIGFELSGRGRFNPQFPFLGELDVAERELLRVLRVMYPEVPDIQAYVSGRLVSNGNNVQALLDFVLGEQQAYEPLRSALEGWVYALPPGSEQAASRRTIAEAISSGWRANRPHSPLRFRPMLLQSLDLSALTDLPFLPAQFSDITRITLRNVTAAEADMSRFMHYFAGVTRLEIIDGGLDRVPQGLATLTQLEELSFEGMGLSIDQPAMEQFMNMPRLAMLDLTGNTLGEITDASRLHISRLYMSGMQLTQWPEWTAGLDLSVLDVSDNQIEHLPQYLIQNEQGAYFRTTFYGSGNPFNRDELLECWLNQRNGNIYELEYDYPDSIRNLARTPGSSDTDSDTDAEADTDSSSDDSEWHTHSMDASPAHAIQPTLDIWIVDGRTQLNARLRTAWERVQQTGEAPNLLILLQRLGETRDFTRVHEELATDVMHVLEAAADDGSLRGELEVMANDRLFGPGQTCQDGVRLIFSDVQVAVYARSALLNVPDAQQTEALFRVVRSLFRLNEVQVIADLEIANREAAGVQVDHAEVRMAYRIGLANELNLPAQPISMVWDRLAGVEQRAILDARRLILEREAGPEFLEYALADRRWTEHLRVEYRADLERVTAPIRAQQQALLEHPPLDVQENLRRRSDIYERLDAAHAANDTAAMALASRDLEALAANPPVDHDAFDQQGRSLMVNLAAAERDLLGQITGNLRQTE